MILISSSFISMEHAKIGTRLEYSYYLKNFILCLCTAKYLSRKSYLASANLKPNFNAMKTLNVIFFFIFASLFTYAQEENNGSTSTSNSGEYHQVQPYLKFRDGRLVYYSRVGYNTDYYLAYDEAGESQKVRHADVESGCLNKKQDLYQFVIRNMGRVKKEYFLREGTRNKYYVIACEDSAMIVCTGMMHAFTGVRSSYATSVVGSNSMGAKTASTNEQYYFVNGEKLYPIEFSAEDVQRWKEHFKHCPSMLEAFKIYEQQNNSSQEANMALMHALGDAYYNDCYVQFDK